MTNTAVSPMGHIFTGSLQSVESVAFPEPLLLELHSDSHTTCKRSAGLKDRWDRHVAAMPTGFVKKLFLGAGSGGGFAMTSSTFEWRTMVDRWQSCTMTQ